jgi:hypothetical protein
VALGFPIRAGRAYFEINRGSGDWLFVDIGFSKSDRTCGVLRPDGTSDVVTFGCLKKLVKGEARCHVSKPLNLVLEAPLSVAFDENGHPARRACDTLRDEHGRPQRDRRGRPQHRDWYVNAGASTLVATTHLLRGVFDGGVNREIRLFEGFLSGKTGRTRNDHIDDVKRLRDVAWYRKGGRIHYPNRLTECSSHRLESAFKVAGMDFGIPPVIFVYPETPCP